MAFLWGLLTVFASVLASVFHVLIIFTPAIPNIDLVEV